ncbi:MAG: type IV pilus secretin PilQ [Gammaproteobacteria bacterium]|nr:type IV pilus secretin PilQ [Gammaproteobacteria bacterium]
MIATLMLLVSANSALAAVLQDISYAVLPGNRVEIRLNMSESVNVSREFTTNNPARISMDFEGLSSALAKRNTRIETGDVLGVTAVEAQGKTRVVIALLQMATYTTMQSGSDFVIIVGSATGAPSIYDESASSVQTSSAQSSMNGSRIAGLDFRRGTAGEGQVILSLSDSDVSVDLRQEGRKVIADFFDTGISDALIRKLDVIDFATPATTIQTSRLGKKIQVVIETANDFEYVAYQTDNIFTIELKPLTRYEAEKLREEKNQFVGERLSLMFQDIEIRAVLQIIAQHTGLNLVASDTVRGNLTLRLQNVPWDQALDIILKTKGLDKRIDGNVMLVAPAQEIAAREKLELEASIQVSELAPLRTELIQINYAKASEIASLLKASENSLLSERGSVSVDERTNTLLVQDTAGKLEEVRDLARKLDVPVRQVQIESRIVTASSGWTEELGVQWGATKIKSETTLSGNLAGSSNLNRQVGNGVALGNAALAPGDVNRNLGDSLNVSLPVNNPAGSFGLTYANLSKGLILDLELSALENENRGEVIASPRVITANQKEATIEAGEEIPFQNATSSGATSVQFKKAVLSLTVTPQITPDDRIILDLTVTQDTRGELTISGPAINTQQVTTQVLVDNGQTVVLGGIYQQRTNRDETSVPFFGDIPYLGWMFKHNADVKSKQELLIFVTPKILKENMK